MRSAPHLKGRAVCPVRPGMKRAKNLVMGFFDRLYDLSISLLDLIFGTLQRFLGVRGMPYIFVLPNLLIFGIFILFPMLLNFVYAFTGGIAFKPFERPWVGTANFERLFDCDNYLDPNTCGEDLFWRAVYNTTGYVVLQVALMVVVFTDHCPDPQSQDQSPRLLPQRFLLPGFAFSYRGRPDLEVDPAGKWPDQRHSYQSGLQQNPLSGQCRLGPDTGHLGQRVGVHGLLYADPAGWSAVDPGRFV